MCNPVLLMVAQAAVGVGTAMKQSHDAAEQRKAIQEQTDLQEDEIAKAAGKELTERARAARRERAAARAEGSAMGLNLESNSFLAALQVSAQNQYNDMGTVIQNERGQQLSRAAQTRSLMNGAKGPNGLLTAVQIGASSYNAYSNGVAASRKGTEQAAA